MSGTGGPAHDAARRPRAGDEDGLTLVELSIVSLMLLVVVGIVAATLVTGVRTARFAETETASVNEGRLAQNQILKDVRSAVALDARCTVAGSPAGSCLRVTTQDRAGRMTRVQYRAVAGGGATRLHRDVGCDAAFVCANSLTLVAGLGNLAQNVAVFTCTTSTTYPTVGVTLIITPPTNQQQGILRLATSARPRTIGAPGC